jgi:very-short-patch-repair endonuclease
MKPMESWKYEYLVHQLHRTAYKQHESYVLGALIHDPRLHELKVATQQYVRRRDCGYALVDIYFPQIKLGLEVDEPYHANQSDADREREWHVRTGLECAIVRIEVARGSVPDQVEALKEEILRRIEAANSAGNWRPWEEPRRIEIDRLQCELKNTLFLKIRGEIHPQDLMARQTGYWRIAPLKRARTKQVIVVHDGVVSRVFTDITWRLGPAEGPNARKWGYDGSEAPDHALVGAIITGWNYQQTVIYSLDLLKHTRRRRGLVGESESN